MSGFCVAYFALPSVRTVALLYMDTNLSFCPFFFFRVGLLKRAHHFFLAAQLVRGKVLHQEEEQIYI